MEIDNKQGKPGRPAHDVSEPVFAWVSVQLTVRATVSEVARAGLEIYASADDVEPVRKLKDKYLEAAYRASERDRIVPWLRPAAGCTHAWPTFMGRALPVPFGAAVPSERKPGRRKNKVRARP
jgi:hypothetical protein